MKMNYIGVLKLVAIISMGLFSNGALSQTSNSCQIPNAAKVVAAFNKENLEMDHWAYYELEDVHVAFTKMNELVISSTYDSKGLTFILQLDQDALVESYQKIFKKAELIYFRKQLVLNSLNCEDRLLVKLGDADVLPMAIDVKTIVEGGGLSRYIGNGFQVTLSMLNEHGSAHKAFDANGN